VEDLDDGPGAGAVLGAHDGRLNAAPERPLAEWAGNDVRGTDDDGEVVREHHASSGSDHRLGLDGLVAPAGVNEPRPQRVLGEDVVE
jgi:hypothetical protein